MKLRGRAREELARADADDESLSAKGRGRGQGNRRRSEICRRRWGTLVKSAAICPSSLAPLPRWGEGRIGGARGVIWYNRGHAEFICYSVAAGLRYFRADRRRIVRAANAWGV
jgi:hypothetical protein